MDSEYINDETRMDSVFCMSDSIDFQLLESAKGKPNEFSFSSILENDSKTSELTSINLLHSAVDKGVSPFNSNGLKNCLSTKNFELLCKEHLQLGAKFAVLEKTLLAWTEEKSQGQGREKAIEKVAVQEKKAVNAVGKFGNSKIVDFLKDKTPRESDEVESFNEFVRNENSFIQKDIFQRLHEQQLREKNSKFQTCFRKTTKTLHYEPISNRLHSWQNNLRK